MSLRISSERISQTVSVLQTARTLAAIAVLTVAACVLLDADPGHTYAAAVLTTAHNWLHAAFNI